MDGEQMIPCLPHILIYDSGDRHKAFIICGEYDDAIVMVVGKCGWDARDVARRIVELWNEQQAGVLRCEKVVTE